MVTDEGLLPCPFCGNEDVKLRTNEAAQMSWVSCPECGLEAPTETGVCEGDAVEYWNRRAALSGSGDGGWRPIETAPKGKLVLLAFENHPTTVGRYELGTWIYAFCATEGGDNPTRWMPLPVASAVEVAK